MKEAAQTCPAGDLKLKAIAEAAPTPTDDEETYSGSVFKRRQRAATEPSEHSISYERAPSPQAPLPSPPPSRDMVVVQEDEGTSTQEEDYGILAWMPLPSSRRPSYPPRPRKSWRVWRRTS